jgi:apolipoprotein N-acyltransferase
VLGAPHYRYLRDAGPTGSADAELHYFASVFLIRGGEILGRYDKMHLVPFGETAPRIAGLALPSPASALYHPGRRPRLLEGERARIGAFLCVEALFPDVARQLVSAGADLLANPSNDEWFAHPAAVRHQLDVASFRAIESGRYLVRVAPGGQSAVIDAHGRTLVISRFGEEALLDADVRLMHGTTPYQAMGDVLVWIALSYWVVEGASHLRVRSLET